MIHSSELTNNPDAVYAQPNRTYDRTPRRGKHKIFIGMAPGVGITFRMLEEGHRLKSEGIDVVIGLLETHGRKETAAKAEGLEIVPKKQMLRGEKILTEMDTDAVLERRPQLALIDELAHTNIPVYREKNDIKMLHKFSKLGLRFSPPSTFNT
jgi:two-component system sensor histidine kinase KdpD